MYNIKFNAASCISIRMWYVIFTRVIAFSNSSSTLKSSFADTSMNELKLNSVTKCSACSAMLLLTAGLLLLH